jgi:hypothetical protein
MFALVGSKGIGTVLSRGRPIDGPEFVAIFGVGFGVGFGGCDLIRG